MSETTMVVNHRLEEAGLVGEAAYRFGSPDRLMLVSGGPSSHLARWSLVAGPSRRRVLVRQPNRHVLPPTTAHSPLNGDLRLIQTNASITAEVEEWKHGSWYHEVTLQARDLEDLMLKLKPLTPNESFVQPHGMSIPERPFWAGALAYDMVQWTQPIRLQYPPKEGALLVVMWLIETGVLVDQASQKTTVFGQDSAWVERAENCAIDDHIRVDVPPSTTGRESVTHTDETHHDNIERVRNGIVNGQVYQVNIGKHWRGEIDHPYAVFQRLLRNNPAPYAAYIEAADIGFALASSSPETLLEIQGDVVRTAPIKGTCPQGEDAEERAMLRTTMLNDEKERAEHRMLVDLMRNDLTQVCRPGSVHVDRFDVEAYANVQHLVSHISGQLSEEATGGSVLQAVFPGGSITGCPRTMVCAVIDELEQCPRSFWTGSAGYIDLHSGRSAWNILIRTLEAHRSGDRWTGSVGAGGGITIASDPSAEVEEAAWKGAALRTAAGWMRPEHTSLPLGPLSIHPVETAPVVSTVASYGQMTEYGEGGAVMERGVLFIDNLDSFSLNIADAVAQTGRNITVLRGRHPAYSHLVDDDAMDRVLKSLRPTHIILGPGPGHPDDVALTRRLAQRALEGSIQVPVLGICLGHQALAVADGRRVVPAPAGPTHGVPVAVEHDKSGLFAAMDDGLHLTRYNSLEATDEGQHVLRVNAREAITGQILSLQHPHRNVFGLQIHPESVGSPDGHLLIQRFLEIQSDG